MEQRQPEYRWQNAALVLPRLPERTFQRLLAVMDEYATAAVLAERERCAKLVETTPAEAFATVMHQGQLQRARETFAAAIRKG